MTRRLHLLDGGAHTTVQDLGRPDRRGAGVALGGAVDPISLRIANLLVGNDESAAAIECALVGPTLRFSAACTIALCGARSRAIPTGTAIRLRARQTLALGPLSRHAFACLAIRGGIDVPCVLGSRSTDTRVGLGGFEGRRLRKGDVLSIGTDALHPATTARANTEGRLDDHAPIRILPGIDAGRCNDRWTRGTFRVSARSDRMGTRLEGGKIDCEHVPGAMSSVVVPGTIQLPPDGNPIVLLADAQTLGGYPRIAHVIDADLPRLAQRRPGSTVAFEWTDLATALRLSRRRERDLAFLRYAIGLHR